MGRRHDAHGTVELHLAGGGTDIGFHNHSALDFDKLKGDPDHIALNLLQYIKGFSANVRDIFLEYFEFPTEIEKLEEANRLYLVVSKFTDIDLHPDSVDNIQMGLIFEDLVRRFNEAANETAGDLVGASSPENLPMGVSVPVSIRGNRSVLCMLMSSP